MKKILWLFFTVWLVARADAQSNAPVRLALIAEGDESSQVSDILSAELSKNPQVQLLERNEIDKVYREQGLSAANRDYLKLGQVLGADGILLLQASESSNNMPAFASSFARNPKTKIDLNVQLIAVRPGVLLTSERFSGLDDIAQWAPGFATHLNPFLPKLTVLPQDAVPISIVNLRAAIQSPEMQEEERQVTTLTIDRLSREPQLFVLERQNLQLLAAEKELKGLNDTAFWNGSFLLDGTLDRNGYSKDTVTISARLVPPKGGAPLQIEVSGSRTNLADVINQLADKVRENLKLKVVSAPWNTADEAEQYFKEAQWASKWYLRDAARAASDSAWALGKQDLECALLRISSRERVIPRVLPPNFGFFSKAEVAAVNSDSLPDPQNIDRALEALELYEDFSRRLPPDEPKDESAYYLLGIDVLGKAAGIIRPYQYHPEWQKPVSDRLVDLRASCRRVAGWISQSPSVRDTFWLEGQFLTSDDVYHKFGQRRERLSESGNFYEFELGVGCLFQETPEDCLELYRTQMSNPLFVCIHQEFWFRDKDNPRLIAWSAEDKKRLPEMWNRFVAEMRVSTNALLGMEARAAQFVDARSRVSRWMRMWIA